MRRTFEVQTGARLHFGPLASGAVTGRRFGGVGMMITAPGISLRATGSDREQIRGGSAQTEDRILRVRQSLGCDGPSLSPLSWAFEFPPTVHAGFGTGTQLSLAAASILIRQRTGTWPSATEIAPQLGRGARSAIGIHGFESGGFMIDAGQIGDEMIGELAARTSFPSDWRIVVIRRTAPQAGLSGSAELAAFEQLPPMSSSLTDRLCRIVLMGVLPALQTLHFEEFANAIAQYGQEVGQYFAPVQGGIYSDPAVRSLPESVRARFVQSSWGPTVVTFASGVEAAEESRWRLLRELGDGWACEIVAPRNEGARRMESTQPD